MLFRSVLRALALLTLLAVDARASAQDDTEIGFAVGGALWAEIGGSRCGEGAVGCSGLNRVFPGATAAFEVDLLHWLRLGLSAGLGYSSSRGTASSPDERIESRHWFVPLNVHSFWRVELGKRITLWGGPEVGLGLYADMQRKTAPGVPAEIDRGTRTAFLAGVAVGLDVRLSGPLRLGLEIGESVLVKPSSDRDKDLDLLAMTRCALVVRYL